MNKFIFELEDIHYSYLNKFPALCAIDMKIEAGEMVAVVGANGSGKSTLLQMLDGLIFPDQGEIKFFGKALNQAAFNNSDFSRYFRSKVGLVFQNPDTQLFCPTVKEDIIFGPLQLGVENNEVNRRLDKLIEIFNLKSLIDRSPHQLSVGERHKVAIASTLAIDPDVMILDEPTAGLDPQTVRQIVDIVIDYNEAGKTIISATHDLHIVEEIADIVYVLNTEKKVAGIFTPHELLSNEKLLKESNLIHIHRHKHKDTIHAHPHQHLEHHLED